MKDNLKMLVDPVYTTSDISKCASAFVMARITSYWLDQGENRIVYWMCPMEDQTEFKGSLPILDDPRVVLVHVPFSKDRYREMWLPGDAHRDQICEWAGPYGDWDIVATTRNNALYYRRMSLNTGKAHKMLIMCERFPLLSFKDTVAIGGNQSGNLYRTQTLQTLINYALFDKVYVAAEFERKGIVKEARVFLSANEAKLISKKTHAVWHGTPLDDQWPLTDEARELFLADGPINLFYTQRTTTGQRQYEKIHKILSVIHAKLKTSGYDINIKVCTNSAGSVPADFQKDITFLNLGKPERTEFWRLLREGHIFISCSSEEGLPTGLTEATCLGVIGVCLRASWSEDLFGSDYPWLAKNEAEVIAFVKWITDHKDEAWETWIEWYQQYFIPHIMENDNGLPMFEDHIQEYLTSVDDVLVESDTVQAIATGLDRAGIDEFDLLCLPKMEGVRNVVDLRTQDYQHTIYFKGLPWRWRISYALRKFHGWEIDATPWKLKRGTFG